jgi:hypothetical protein
VRLRDLRRAAKDVGLTEAELEALYGPPGRAPRRLRNPMRLIVG